MSTEADEVPASHSLGLRAGLLALVVLAGFAGALWVRYGGAVFVEMLATAWAFCF